jgi:hypothetical protein
MRFSVDQRPLVLPNPSPSRRIGQPRKVRRGKGCAPKAASRGTPGSSSSGFSQSPGSIEELDDRGREYREIAECSDYSPPIGDRTLVERDIRREFHPKRRCVRCLRGHEPQHGAGQILVPRGDWPDDDGRFELLQALRRASSAPVTSRRSMKGVKVRNWHA